MLQVTLPDGTNKQYEQSITPADIAAEIGPGLAKAAVAAEVDETIVGLDYQLPADGEVALRLLTKKDPEALGVMRHSCAHVMARAVMRLLEGVQLAFGPTVEGGFYYDFDLRTAALGGGLPGHRSGDEEDHQAGRAVRADRWSRVARRCRSAATWSSSTRSSTSKRDWQDHETVSFYRQGEFLDLCRGPHVPVAGAIGAFKLLSMAGAYWKGDASRPQLQRLYGTAFFNKQDLDEHLQMVEEAKRRDHRVLGKRLELFTISPLVGSGLILWQPKGAIDPRAAGEFHQGRAAAARLPARLHAEHRPGRAVQDLGALSLLHGQHVHADRDGG